MSASPTSSFRRLFQLKIVILALLLGAHFFIRLHATQSMPAAARRFYPRNYESALSMLAGRGFDVLPLADNEAARPVREFLAMQRDRISSAEFDAYVRSLKGGDDPGTFQVPIAIRRLELTGRILDMRAAAVLWWIFGISWPVLFAFYCLISTLVCLLVFLIARQISDSYGAGLAAALLFMASPLESQYCARSIRDVSPFWFMALGFFALVCVAGRFKAPKWRWVSYFASGAAAMIGLGWRADVLLLPPFLAVCLIAMLRAREAPWRQIALALVLFFAGAAATRSAVLAVGPKESMSADVAFHMAYYGHASRCNLLGVENSFQIPRDDRQTCIHAQFYGEVNHGHVPEFCTPEYGRVCKEMYFETLKHDAFNWTAGFPKFYWLALNAFAGPGSVQGEPRSVLYDSRPAWLKALFRWCLDPLASALPLLFAIGAVAALLLSAERVCAAGLAVFSVYYAAILLLVLPERKHAAPLLLPLCVLGGVGLWTVVRALKPQQLLAELRAVSPRVVKVCGWSSAALLVLWLAGCLLAYEYSASRRREYVTGVMDRAASGKDAADGIKSPNLFSAHIVQTGSSNHGGYLLKISRGAGPATLSCAHLHPRHDAWWWGMRYATRHALLPERVQYFYVSIVNGARFGDPRPYTCTVSLDGDAEILSAKVLNTADWKGLPLSIVFSYGDESAGGPRAPAGQLSTETGGGWDNLSEYGLPVEWHYRHPELVREWSVSATFEKDKPAILLPSPSGSGDGGEGPLPLDKWLPAAHGVATRLESGGVSVTTLPGRYAYAAAYAPLTVAEDGTYLYCLRYTLESGGLMFGALNAGRARWLGQAPESRDGTALLRLTLKAGAVFHLLITNRHPTGNAPSSFRIRELAVLRDQSPRTPRMLPVAFPESGPGIVNPAALPDPGLRLDHWLPAAEGASVALIQDGATVSTLRNRGSYAAIYGPLQAAKDGAYVFVVRCRIGFGGFSFGALSGNKSRWLAHAGPAFDQGGETCNILVVNLKKGESVNLVLMNNHPAGDIPSQFTIKALHGYEDHVPRWKD